jgi:cytochrome b involved in lipid metabolism
MTKQPKYKKTKNNPKQFSMQYVAKHNTINDAWTVIHNKVFHIPPRWILHDHPGGRIIERAIGIDATKLFDMVGHSGNALKKMEDFYIGDLIR